MTPIVLASRSASRRAILESAGIAFDAVPADIDEGAIKRAVLESGGTPADAASRLAREKALAVSAAGGTIVIGADQVMEFEGHLYDKPRTMTEAAGRLLAMADAPHHLRGGLAVARAGRIVFEHRESATLTLRSLSAGEIDAYLSAVGSRVLATVGAYELEGPGVRLFSAIEGDYFGILGLPLLPLMGFLRSEGVLPW